MLALVNIPSWWSKVKLTSAGFGKCTLVLAFNWMVEGLNLVARSLFLTQNVQGRTCLAFYVLCLFDFLLVFISFNLISFNVNNLVFL